MRRRCALVSSKDLTLTTLICRTGTENQGCSEQVVRISDAQNAEHLYEVLEEKVNCRVEEVAS